MKVDLKWYWTIRRVSPRLLKRTAIFGFACGILLLVINMDYFLDEKFAIQEAKYRQQHHILWMEAMAKRMESRRQKLKANCELLGLDIRGNDSLHRPNAWEFLINRPHHLVWCNVFKAASTSWMYNFNVLAGYREDFLQRTNQVPLQLARKKYFRPNVKNLESALNDSTSFIIVRHPFERLLSGYRDKMEAALPDTYHYKLGTQIALKYRGKIEIQVVRYSNGRYRRRLKHRVTFYEFVQYVLHLYRNNLPLDMHWTPITNFCTPCQVKFDIIMKFETLKDDQNYLIRKTKLHKWIKPQWKNKTKKKKKVMELIKNYYSALNSTQIFQLYNMFKYDFYLFEYNMNDYLQYMSSQESEIVQKEFKLFVQ